MVGKQRTPWPARGRIGAGGTLSRESWADTPGSTRDNESRPERGDKRQDRSAAPRLEDLQLLDGLVKTDSSPRQ